MNDPWPIIRSILLIEGGYLLAGILIAGAIYLLFRWLYRGDH